jgi:hypothetical protein
MTDLLSLEVSPDPYGVRPARRAVSDRLRELGINGGCEIAALLTSEIVSNAVRLRPRTIRLDVRSAHDTIRIEACAEGVDFGSADPPPRDDDEERSLAVVAGLARHWGLRRSRDGTDLTWLELDATA